MLYFLIKSLFFLNLDQNLMPKVDFTAYQKPQTVKQIKISILFTIYSSDGRENVRGNGNHETSTLAG